MTPGPSLEDLIDTVRVDSPSDDPIDRLATAARTAAELEEIADEVLAHYVAQCRQGGRSWSEISKALGVSKQAVHKRFSPSPVLERFTPRARAVLPAAIEVARALGHLNVGTDHVLLALLADPGTVAAEVLNDAGVMYSTVAQQLPAKMSPGPATSDAPHLTPQTTQCIEKALPEAALLGHNYVGTEHLLLALFSEPEGLGARILNDAGATHDGLRPRVIETLARRRQPGS